MLQNVLTLMNITVQYVSMSTICSCLEAISSRENPCEFVFAEKLKQKIFQ